MDESLFQNTSFLSRQKKHIVRSKLRKGQSLIDRFYAQTPVIVRHLCDTYGIAPERFSLCPPGVELHREKLDHARNDFISQHTGQDIMGRFCLFYPARCYDHKNHASIIRAYQEHRDQLKNTCCIFTIDAETNPIAKERMSEVHALGLSEQIINIGPIDHSMVMKWFEAADALLMPTTMETFGIPFLEAMVTETPVIASDRDFSRAVCGDAALYVDPLDPQDICEAIVRLQDDPTLREELQTKGTVQAQQYKSWDGVIRDVLRNESIPCIPDS